MKFYAYNLMGNFWNN